MKISSLMIACLALFSVCTIGGAGCAFPGGTTTSESSVQVESEMTEDSETSSAPDESESVEDSSSLDESESTEDSSSPDESESENSENSEANEDSETSEEPEKPNTSALTIKTAGEVFPYLDCVKEYLQAGEGAVVGDYYQEVNSQWAPVKIEWKWNATGARKFRIEYATKADYSDAITEEAGASKRSIEVYNLYKATTYYLRISALNSRGEAIETQEGEFYTTDLGPRFIKVDDVRNVRDLGGYETNSGKTLVQGIAYRGGGLTIPPRGGQTNQISDDGKAYMSEVMGIKAEIDFRTAFEAGITLEQGSVIPGASLTYITLNSYAPTFDYDDEYLQFFTMLADEDNYPVYMHCTGGADRTGSVVYLLHTLLGVSELECLQGYELTSFSSYGLRDTQGNYKDSHFQPFMDRLNSYAGNTKQEKVETWVRSIGVTQTQIDKIKAIFYGEVEIEGKSFKPQKKEAPMKKKALNEQLSDLLAAWVVQKKGE